MGFVKCPLEIKIQDNELVTNIIAYSPIFWDVAALMILLSKIHIEAHDLFQDDTLSDM